MEVYSDLVSAGFEKLAAHPANTFLGRVYFNTTSNAPFYYNGTKWEVFTSIKNKVDAVVDPVVGDDNTGGYEVGSIWINTVSKDIFMLIDDATGAAVWRPLENQKTNYSALIAPTENDDALSGYSIGSKWVVPVDGTIFFCVDASAGAALWSQGGGGLGSLDYFYSENFEITKVADLTLVGTLTVIDEEVAPLSGKRSIKATQAAGSLGATLKSVVIPLSPNEVDTVIGFQGRYKYDGDDFDYDFVVYDETNSAELVRMALPKQGKIFTFKALCNTLATTANISYYFEVMTENIGSVLEFVNIEGRVNPLQIRNQKGENDYSARIKGSLNVNSGDAVTITSQDSDVISSVTHGVTTASWTINFKSGEFTTPPSITGSVEGDNGWFLSVQSVGTLSADIRIISHLGTAGDRDFTIQISRQGADHNPIAPEAVYESALGDSDSMIRYNGAATRPVAPILAWSGLQDNIGNDIQVTANSEFKVLTDGAYSISQVTNHVSLADSAFVTKNSVIAATGDANTLAYGFSQENGGYSVSLAWTGILNKGDIIRGLSNSALSGTAHKFTISKAKSQPLYSVPVTNKVENKFSAVVKNDAGTVSITSYDANFIQSVSHVSTGVVLVTWVSGFFTVPPAVTGDVINSNRDLSFSGLSTTSVTVRSQLHEGTPFDRDFSLFVTKQLSDYIAPKGYFLGTMPRTYHTTNGVEYKTADTMDGKPIYARTYVLTADLTSGAVVASLPAGLKPVDWIKFTATDWSSGTPVSGATNYVWFYYQEVSGSITAISAGAYSHKVGTTILFRYTK